MELQGTGYIIEIMIDSVKGTLMRDLDFSVSFFVYTNRRETFHKRDLIHIQMDKADKYYALLDSSKVGIGELKCDITINDPEPRWAGGARPVILRHSTGKFIGTSCGSSMKNSQCGEYEEGYKVLFNFVYGLPKAEVAYIFYGHLVNQITSYAEITSDMLVSPENHIISVGAGKMGKTSCGVMEEGDKVVVLIPVDTDYKATKDNGFGGQMPFNSQILGSNGENIVTIDGVQYRAYGEMMTTEGEMFVYVN